MKSLAEKLYAKKPTDIVDRKARQRNFSPKQ